MCSCTNPRTRVEGVGCWSIQLCAAERCFQCLPPFARGLLRHKGDKFEFEVLALAAATSELLLRNPVLMAHK